jgi:hypothetical protein
MEKCTISNKNRLIVFQENKSKLTINNKDRVEAKQIEVDGCQITDGIRCDFLLLAKDLEIFIELKGQDLKHALEQIEATITQLSSDFRKKSKTSIIVCTRSPLTSATILHKKKIFRKKFNSELIIKNTPCNYDI